MSRSFKRRTARRIMVRKISLYMEPLRIQTRGTTLRIHADALEAEAEYISRPGGK